MSRGGFTLVDFTIPTRELPVAHPGAQAPLCEECRSRDLCFFDPNCFTCQDILLDQRTSISELFAVMRQWVPQTQKNMASLTREVLRRGANVNDRDDLTDLTLLHYASKSGAIGVGNETSAANLVKSLIAKGANTEMRCRWTNMNALHYAVFFDAPEVVEALAEQTPSLVMGACSEFNNGNSLHIAAANLSLESAKILVKHEADGTLKDDKGHLPYECIPEIIGKEQVEVAEQLRELLKAAAENPPLKPSRSKQVSSLVRPSPSHSPTPPNLTPSHKPRIAILQAPASPTLERRSPVTREAAPSPKGGANVKQSSRTQSPLVEEITMATLGLKVGDRVVIDASASKPKYGTIRFGGTTEFHAGQWAGIELDEERGKNDGSYGGIRYFTCKPKYGLFVPMHRISKAGQQTRERRKKAKETKGRDSLAATNKAIDAQAQLQMNTDLQVGDRVVVAGSRMGMVRFTGAVKFAPGFWLGVELDNSHGKNDGSVDGVRYFQCRPKYGLFVPPSRVKRHTGSQLSAPRSSASSSSTNASASTGGEATDSSSLPSSLVSSGASGSSDALATSPSPHASPRSPRRRGTPSSNKSSSSSTSRAKHLRVSTPAGTASPTPLSLATASDPVLEEGMSVLVSKELGVVRFIGTTEFAEGVWLGIELRKPNGKNDGSVQGKRYFTCKPNYGRFVRPEKASHRGINCAKLLQSKADSSKT